MPIQLVGGYDNSVAPWQDTVDLPGQFGPGGFRSDPRLTPPVGPPRGVTMGAPSVPSGASGPQILSPQGSNIGTGKEVGPWTNPSTDATPSPQMMAELAKARGSGLPAFLRSNPLAAFLYSTLYSTPADTGEMPRQTLGRRPSGPVPAPGVGPVGSDANFPVSGAAGFPMTYAAPGQQPAGLGGPMPPSMRRPSPAPHPRPVAGPAAVAQRPNLGYYDQTIAQPNIARTGNVRGGIAEAPQMGAFDFSRLFSRPPSQTGQY